MDTTQFTLLPPLDLRDRFPGLRAELVALLRGLSPEEWNRETVCPGWSVKDIAAHLLADDLGRLSWGRDRFVSPTFAAGLDIDTLPGFIQAIDRQNEVWVAAARRFSPAVLLALLTVSGEWTEAYFASLDLNAIGMPVDWASPDPAPVWLDVAREYTERWVHQQQIRDAVGKPGLKERQWLHPVLATFVRALPLALTPVNAPDGTAVRLTITGDAGGAWVARRDSGRWLLGAAPDLAADATVTLDQETAWRLFTKGISQDEARQRSTIAGDRALAERILETVAILA